METDAYEDMREHDEWVAEMRGITRPPKPPKRVDAMAELDKDIASAERCRDEQEAIYPERICPVCNTYGEHSCRERI